VRQLLVERQLQRDALLAHLRAEPTDRLLMTSDRSTGLALEMEMPGLDRGQADQVVEQPVHAVGVALDALEELALQRADDAGRLLSSRSV
jgi:hypothetical protein